MKFLWHSNAPWVGTGYGAQTKLMLKALQDLGHEPSCSAFWGLQGGILEYDGYLCWPQSPFDEYSNDVVKAHIENSKSEAIVTLLDLFVLDEKVWSNLSVPWIAWTPVDHADLAHEILSRLKICNYPVAMSNFGQAEIEEKLQRPVHRIYHAVDTDVFTPHDNQECREEFGIDPDCYLVGMVMANKGDRKLFPEQLKAVAQWIEQNPDRDIRLFVHTDPTPKMGGHDMPRLVEKLGLKGKVYSTSQYYTSIVPLPTEQMARIYSSMDVLMNCSAGEGFGVPIIEAQACGVPVIVGNYTAMPELVHYGYVVEPDSVFFHGLYGVQYRPSIEDMCYRLECVYRMASKQNSAVGIAGIEQNFSVPVIADQWHNLLKRVADEH